MKYFEITIAINGWKMEASEHGKVSGITRNRPANVREIFQPGSRRQCFVKLITILIAVRVNRILPQAVIFRGAAF